MPGLAAAMVVPLLLNLCKGGRPGIAVVRPGYHDSVTYYERWQWGLKYMRVTIVLRKAGQ